MTPPIDYEAEYNNRARVPEHPEIMAGWARDAAAYREVRAPRVLRYGDGERHTIDLFEAGAAATVVFIHGGYWQATSPAMYSHLARGLNERGISVALPSYDLCPAVRIGDIVEQIRTACALIARERNAPVIVSGHSAGGHLAACMLATEAHVPAAYAISGLFDLTTLVPTSLNAALKLDAEEAENLSPIRWPAPEGKILDAVVGGAESAEFLRQSRAMAEAWGEEGAETRYVEIDGANHFTVIAPLADRDSDMCARLEELARAAS